MRRRNVFKTNENDVRPTDRQTDGHLLAQSALAYSAPESRDHIQCPPSRQSVDSLILQYLTTATVGLLDGC